MSSQQIAVMYVLWLWEGNAPAPVNVVSLAEVRRARWMRRYTRPMGAA